MTLGGLPPSQIGVGPDEIDIYEKLVYIYIYICIYIYMHVYIYIYV